MIFQLTLLLSSALLSILLLLSSVLLSALSVCIVSNAATALSPLCIVDGNSTNDLFRIEEAGEGSRLGPGRSDVGTSQPVYGLAENTQHLYCICHPSHSMCMD